MKQAKKKRYSKSGSVAKNKQIGALLNFFRVFLNVGFQMATLPWRRNPGLC